MDTSDTGVGKFSQGDIRMMTSLKFFNKYTLADKHYGVFNLINQTRQAWAGPLAVCCSADTLPACDKRRQTTNPQPTTEKRDWRRQK